MPVGSFIAQPILNSIHAAYRPVIIRVSATATDASPRPPVVYCDIYFNDVFYKTIAKSQYKILNDTDSEWQFDLQDAAQEYLKKYLAINGGAGIVTATPIVLKAICKIRSSGYDSNGFIQHEGTAPVQGTGSSDPVPGTGTSSNQFFVVNATLQHIDNQDLSTHLNSFKKRTWADTTWPLTHRPDTYMLCKEDSDYFPLLHGGANELNCIVLKYMNVGQTSYQTATNCSIVSCPVVQNIVSGVVNNGDDTQTFTFTFDALSVIVSSLIIEYRISGSSDLWSSSIGTISSPRTVTLPLGLYDFRFKSTGACAPQTSEQLTGLGISAAGCTVVGIMGTPSLPNATEGIAYSYSINLTGSAPFSLSTVVKPSWMTIAITGSTVNFTGTPSTGDIATGVAVSFFVNNACTTDTVPFSDTLDVVAAAGCTAVGISGGPVVLPDADEGAAYSHTITLTGDGPFSLSSVVKPAWMFIAVVGSTIEITGTPDATHVGTSIPVSFTVSNCSGAHTADVSDEIDVIATSGDEHTDITNYAGTDNFAVTGICTFECEFMRSAEAAADSLAANERIELHFHAVADNFCEVDASVIFEPGDTIATVDVNMTCGGGSNFCSAGSISLTFLEVIP